MSENYERYRLPELWASVAGEDPEAGFMHVNTLNRLRVALEQQRNDLRVHRDRLIEGWPPERSQAANAFVGRINGLIDAMTFTADATGRICVGADEAFAAIRELRRQLEPMMAEYTKRLAGAGLVSVNAGNPGLDREARAAYIAADAKIAKASRSINASLPAAADQARNQQIIDDQDLPGQAGIGARPSTGRGSSGSAQSAMLAVPVFDPPAPSGSNPEGPGPVLSGGAVDAPDSLSGPYGWTSNGGGAGPSRPPSGSASAPFGVLGPGGVIGAPRAADSRTGQAGTAPMTGVAPRSGAPASSARGTGRGAARPAATARPASGVAGTGGYRDRSYEAYVQRRRSREAKGDQLWAVDEGVPPVLEAPPARHHDPGPGVLGIDR